MSAIVKSIVCERTNFQLEKKNSQRENCINKNINGKNMLQKVIESNEQELEQSNGKSRYKNQNGK